MHHVWIHHHSCLGIQEVTGSPVVLGGEGSNIEQWPCRGSPECALHGPSYLLPIVRIGGHHLSRFCKILLRFGHRHLGCLAKPGGRGCKGSVSQVILGIADLALWLGGIQAERCSFLQLSQGQFPRAPISPAMSAFFFQGHLWDLQALGPMKSLK